MVSSLQEAFACRDAPWSLAIEADGLVHAGWFTEQWEYLKSFFSSQHTVSLREKMEQLLCKITPFTEEQKILLGKISAVIHRHKSSWLYGLTTSLPKPAEIKASYAQMSGENLLQPVREGDRYVNFSGERIWRQFLETLYLLLPGSFSKASSCENLQRELCESSSPLARAEAPEITWLGHATTLVQVNGFNLLLDPAFHFCPPCFLRHTPPGISLEKLPLIDVVAISHNHADHCEPYALHHLSSMQPFAFVPQGLAKWTRSQGYLQVKENVWWEQTTLEKEGKKITLTSIPAQHGSQQTLMDLNTSLWQGMMIETEEHTLYFAGDTALQEGLFEQIHEKFPSIDIAFLPIAPEREQKVHLDCEQALIAFERVKAKAMLPIHWGAYRQAQEVVEDPRDRLEQLLEGKFSHLQKHVHIAKIGERFSVETLLQAGSTQLDKAS